MSNPIIEAPSRPSIPDIAVPARPDGTTDKAPATPAVITRDSTPIVHELQAPEPQVFSFEGLAPVTAAERSPSSWDLKETDREGIISAFNPETGRSLELTRAEFSKFIRGR